ncbi:MAG: NAD(P)(+) transhydrogenase (Re/Si-specific) subunit alpha, partial [Pseudomonadota bacterium]
MLIAVPRETWPGELRAALVPQNAKKLINAGFEIAVESGVGNNAGFSDAAFEEVGVKVEPDRAGLLSRA